MSGRLAERVAHLRPLVLRAAGLVERPPHLVEEELHELLLASLAFLRSRSTMSSARGSGTPSATTASPARSSVGLGSS